MTASSAASSAGPGPAAPTSNPASIVSSGGGGTAPPPTASNTVSDAIASYRLMEAMRTADFDALTVLAAPHAIPRLQPDLHAKFGSILLLAISIAPTRVAEWLLTRSPTPADLVNTPHPTTKETPLHVAARTGRDDLISVLLNVPGINDGARDAAFRRPVDLARSDAIRQRLAEHQSQFIVRTTAAMHELAAANDFLGLVDLFKDPRTSALIDINHRDPTSGHSVLHTAARLGNDQMVKWCLAERRADPFVRDRKGKYFYEITKNDDIKALFKKYSSGASPMTVAAPDQMPQLAGILHKWTNLASGYKGRWFTLERGVLSYYKHQDDVPNACRGSIHLKIASLWVDASDRHRFDVIGKGSVRYHLRAEHVAEASRWIHAIAQSKAQLNDMEKVSGGKAFGSKGAVGSSVGKAGSAPPSEHVGSPRMGTLDSSALLPPPPVLGDGASDISASAGGGLDAHGVPLATYAPGTPMVDSHPALPGAPFTRRASVESHNGNGGQADDDMHSADVGPPHKEQLAMVINALRVQIEMQANLVGSIPDPQLAQALTMVTTTVRHLVDDMVAMADDREEYWRRRCDEEQMRKTAFEEALSNLASEYQAVETEARSMAHTLRKTQRQMQMQQQAFVASSSAIVEQQQPPALAVAPPPATQDAAAPVSPVPITPTNTVSETFATPATATSPAPPMLLPPGNQITPWGASATTNAAGDDLSSTGSDVDETDDDDDEFFDAVDDETAEEVKAADKALIAPSLAGYESDDYSFVQSLRPSLPVDHALLRNEVSLWSVLKNAIGKDLTRITLPVYFNEPISMLQRLCEEIEYSVLLDLAWKRERSDERLLLVTAFAISSYASTVDRVGKPFNPLLGETYEYVRKDRGFRYISEQVSHHPPVSACFCESEHYKFYGEVFVKNKFYGKSLEVHPLGVCHVDIKRGHVGEKDEHYTWRKVTTTVHNLIIGKLWIDHTGDLEVTNHATGERCVVTFKPTGWRNKDRAQVEGKLFDATGRATWSIQGSWDDKLVAKPLVDDRRAFSLCVPARDGGGDAGSPPPPGDESVKSGGSGKNTVTLWRRYSCTLSPSNFNLTPFAMTLNQLPPGLTNVLCPTDARLRPDQRAMEEGRYDDASFEKNRLEEKQRAARREKEAEGNHDPHRPRWFVLDQDPDSGERYWRFTHEYWDARAKGKWDGVPDIY